MLFQACISIIMPEKVCDVGSQRVNLPNASKISLLLSLSHNLGDFKLSNGIAIGLR